MITELLGIKYPIIQGGMAWVSEAELTSAVSNQGGAGIIAAGGRTTEWVREEIRLTKKKTDKPFGVNIALLVDNAAEQIEMLCEEKVDFITIGAGDSIPYFEMIKNAGIKVIPVVPNSRIALKVEKAGADAIIVEGMEAGGHVGTQTLFALLTNIIPEINIPVIAAGGIVDGRGMAGALLMGAAGIQMGTRFLLTHECKYHQAAKERILKARDYESVLTGYSRGMGCRCLQNEFTTKYLEMEKSGIPLADLDELARGTNRKAGVNGDIENGMVAAGESVNVLNEIISVEEVFTNILRDAAKILKNGPSLASALEV